LIDHGLPTSPAETLGDLVTLNAKWFGDDAAITASSASGGQRTITYRELDDLTTRLARGLQEAGVGRGDRVGFLCNNDSALEAVLIYSAVHKAAGVALPINGRLVPVEVVAAVRHSGTSTMIVGNGFEPHAEAVAATDDLDVQIFQVGGDGRFADFEHLFTQDADVARLPEVTADDHCDWLYTSGTTGQPKCVMLTHRNCVAAAHILGRVFTIRDDDVHLTPFPFFTSSGTHTSYLSAMSGGAHYWVSENTRAELLAPEIERAGATIFGAVPAIYSFMINSPESRNSDLSLVRHCWFGGAAMNAALVSSILDLFPRAEAVNVFGQTESGNPGLYLPGKFAVDKAGSIGHRGMPGIDVRVVADDGTHVERDGVGEVMLRGASIMAGYYENPEATAAAFTEDGWLRTGDLVKVDEDGFLYVHDRLKDIIIRGGHNVASIEVESVLNDHPDVVEAAVVAKPHPVLGEDVLAFVVLTDGSTTGADELRGHCEPRIADYKVPRHFVFIDALPRNPTGKILKRELREQVRAEATAPTTS
jgi:acyl-CoA synthetase (AMP-forming)/AMP-acid ligase II